MNVISEYHLNRYQPDKPQFVLHDLNKYLKTNQCQAIKPHIHSFYQVIWFKNGTGKHCVDFKTYDVVDNAILFVAPNQVHYFDENTHYNGELLHFNQLFLAHDQSALDFFLNQNLFNNSCLEPSCCIGTDAEGILNQYISQIKHELEDGEAFGKELLLGNYLKSFLIQIQRIKNKFEKSANPFSPVFDEKENSL